MHLKSNAPPRPYVPYRQTGESPMKATDLDREGASLPEMPSHQEWLRVVGTGVAIILICAIWTFWA